MIRFRFRSTWLCTLALLSLSCTNRPSNSDSVSSSTGTRAAGTTCDVPNPGCPCTSPGLSVSCGQVDRRSGDYVSCSLGMETCQANGQWGACIGDTVAPSVYAPQGGLKLSTLGSTSSTCVNNPCDPSCMVYNDSPTSIDAGTGLAVGDSGVGIVGTLVAPGSSSCTGLAPMANQTMTVTSLSPITTTPGTANFSTSILPSGCYSGTLTPLWGVDRYDLGVVNSNGAYTEVVPVPAVIKVTAYAGSYSTSANVTVTVNVSDTTSGPAPAGYTAAKFSPAVAASGSAEALPKMLYPYTGTIFPLGLTAPLVMWQRAGAAVAKATQVSLRSTGFSWAAIIPEGTQRFQIPQAAWTAFGQATTGATGTIVLQRIDSAGKLQAEVPISVTFSTANLRGRIYYATYANGNPNVNMILPYGSAAPVSAYTPAVPSGNCGVCHSISADGSKFVASSEDVSATPGIAKYAISNVNSDGTLTALNVGPTGAGDSRGLAYAPITRNGTYALQAANWWGNVNSGSNATTAGSAGAQYKIYQLPTVVNGAYTDVSNSGAGGSGKAWGLNNAQMYAPVFSPDNTRLLFVDGDTAGGAAARQGVSYFTYNESAKQFSGRTLAVKTTSSPTIAALKNMYVRWPTFEDDSRSVIFQTQPTSNDDGFDWYAGMLPSGCCGRQKNPGQLWSVDLGATGGSPNTPVALTNVNTGLGSSSPLGTDDTNRSYQPTMLGASVGGYRWMVFTSLRAYGNYLNTATGALVNSVDKLWVGAVNDATSGATDRSHPPFFLPNQDLSTSTLNERGYWVLDACKDPDIAASTCATSDECCGYNAANVAASTALCQVDSPLASPPTFHCKSTSSATCKAVGASCGQNTDCCGFPPNPICVSGTCQSPPSVTKYLSPATYTRDYTATCATGKAVVWRFFDWESLFPASTGSSIVFKAATATSQATLGASTQVNLATQTATNTTWTGADVSAALKGATPAQVSQAWLRIYMTFNPTTDLSGTPILTAWRQSYDCIDAQ